MAPSHSWKECSLEDLLHGSDEVTPAESARVCEAARQVALTDRQRRYLHLHHCVGLQDAETFRVVQDVHALITKQMATNLCRTALKALGMPRHLADGPLPTWLLTPGKVKIVCPIKSADPDHLVPEPLLLARRLVRCHTCTVDCWEIPTLQHRDAEIICFDCLRNMLRREYENAKGIHRS